MRTSPDEEHRDVGRFSGFAHTLRRLGGAQKSGRGPAYLRYVNRRLARPLAAAAYHLRLTPNTVTWLSATCTLTGIVVLAVATPSWLVGAFVTVVLLLGFALDSADGQLARLTGGGSLAGEWLDHVCDAVKVCSIHVAVLLAVHHDGSLGTGWLLVPLGFSVVGTLAYFSNQLHDQLVRSPAPPSRPRSETSVARSILLLPTDYGVLCMTFLLLGSMEVFIAAYSTLLALRVVHLSHLLRSQFAEVRAIDRDA